MYCLLVDGCRGAAAVHSGPAVIREKIKERYGELIVDILIRFIGSCESATIACCAAVTACLNANCEMREGIATEIRKKLPETMAEI
jgi:hypothetical protein